MMVKLEFARGEILKCGTCTAVGIVIRKDQVPEGWQVLLETNKARDIIARLVCPTCNAAEVERWKP